MKKHAEARVQDMYKANERSFKARKVVTAEITYFRCSHSSNHSGPAHSNRNDPKFHVTVVCKDANERIVVKRHAYVDDVKK